MIPYEDLCAALDRYNARVGGATPQPYAAPSQAQAHAYAPQQPPSPPPRPQRVEAPEPPTGEHELPPLDAGHGHGEYEDEHTIAGGQPVPQYDDGRSNEIDIDDLLHDESEPHDK
jgi:hypothetical protein